MSPYHKYRPYDPRYHSGRALTDLGRRGIILLCLGVLWVFTGLATATAPSSPDYPLLTAEGRWEELRGAAWIITGLVAVVCARRRQGDDWPGWVALYVMAAWRLTAYGHGVLLWLGPWDGGNPRAMIGVLAWATALVPLVVCSGWEEPPARSSEEPAA